MPNTWSRSRKKSDLLPPKRRRLKNSLSEEGKTRKNRWRCGERSKFENRNARSDEVFGEINLAEWLWKAIYDCVLFAKEANTQNLSFPTPLNLH
jgi:hypothetical protein